MVALVLHWGWLYIFVVKLDLGVQGAAHAMTISQAVSYGCMLLFQTYLVEKEHAIHKMVFKPSLKDFDKKETLSQLGFGLVCAFPGVFGWAAYEVLVVFSSYLGAANSAAFVISMQLDNFAYSCAYGVQIATVALVGFEIGAGNIQEARRIGRYLVLHIFIVSFFTIFMVWILDSYIIAAYTPDKEIQKSFLTALPALLLLIFNDSFIAIVYGLNKSLAKQEDLILTIFVPLYFIGMPLEYYLGMKTDLGISGLLLGLFTGVAISNLWNAYLVWGKYDWSEISRKV